MPLPKGTLPRHVTPKQFDHPAQEDSFISLLLEIEDPRKPSIGFKYSLVSVLFMVVASLFCGAKDWAQVVEMSEGMQDWLGKIVDMKAGVPCESTFINILNGLSPEAMTGMLVALGERLRKRCGREIIAFDGQSLRGTASPVNGQAALHLLHAWSVQNGFCLGQKRVDEKTNEIPVLKELAELLDLKHTIVTADALHTQTETVIKLTEQGADYVLPVKGNQENLLNEVDDSYTSIQEEATRHFHLRERHLAKAFAQRDRVRATLLQGEAETPFIQESEIEKGHGRIEKRTYTFWSAHGLQAQAHWKNLSTLCCVERERWIGDRHTSERMYYISSLSLKEHVLFQEAIRRHWTVENSLHWKLDVAFRQDASRYRHKVGATNLAILRKCALTALSRETSSKRSIPAKQARACIDPNYRNLVLQSLVKNLF